MEEYIMKVKGMDCGSCATGLENYFKKFDDIEASVSLATEEIIFRYDANKWSIEDLANNVRSAGYKPMIKVTHEKTMAEKLETLEISLALAATLFLIAPMVEHLGITNVPNWVDNPWLQFWIALPIQFIVGRRFYKGAYRSIKHKTLGMDVLIVLSTTIAFVSSAYILFTDGNGHYYFDISAEIITFLLIGKIIEARVKRRSQRELSGLMEAQINDVSLEDGTVLPVSKIEIGMRLLVRKGEKVPVDGTVIEGKTSVNEAALTGESMPISKTIGDNVLSGSINTGGYIIVEVTSDPKNSLVNRIIETVRNLQMQKPPIQKIADKISNIFVPLVASIALLTFTVWSLTKGVDSAVSPAIATLVVACPCALGLATPVSIQAGSSRASKEGILYNKADVFERFRNIDVICFDKTGTITTGEFVISEIIGDEDSIKDIVSIEVQSLHPISMAFMDWKHKNPFEPSKINDYTDYVGKGVGGTVDGNIYLIGSMNFIAESIMIPDHIKEKEIEFTQQGKVVIAVSKNGVFNSLYALEDEIKPTAKKAIEEIKSRGMIPVMITGDNQNTASYVAKQVGINTVHSRIMPEQKAQIVKDYQDSGKRVLFAGDGVNDAVALNQADFSVAMAEGSDVAKSSADITLLDGDLSTIIIAIDIAAKTLKNIKQNLVWAFLWNGTTIPLAAFGQLTPFFAAIAMSVESTVVILNAARLSRMKVK